MRRSTRPRPCWYRWRFRHHHRSLRGLSVKGLTRGGMWLRTELVEKAVVGTLGVGAAALGESRLRRLINGSADDANGSYERDECGGERYHSGRL